MKGVIKPDHIPKNKFELVVLGLLPFVVTRHSGLEEEVEVVDLPDRTRASGGMTRAGEFEIDVPMHHLAEQLALEGWFKEGQDPITPTYKKAGSLLHKSGTGKTIRSYSLIGLWISKRVTPELDMENEGEMATVTYTFQWDDVLPI